MLSADDLVVGDVVEVLHERPQAVPVGRDQDPPAGGHGRGDLVVPVRQEPRDGVLERLRPGQVGVVEVRVAPVAAREPLVAGSRAGGGMS